MWRYDPGDELTGAFRRTGEAGIHPCRPWMPACAGMTNQGENHALVGMLAISYSVDERKLVKTSW
jgi:hypothetical protein